MDNILFPSLSEDGWLDNALAKADALFSHFIISDYSQSYVYNNQVTSFPYILQKNQNNIIQLQVDLKSQLELYFGRYFSNVISEVNEVPNLINPSLQQISIFISFVDHQNKTYSLGKLLEYSDLKVRKIIDISNG